MHRLVPLISPTAGRNSDGVFWGVVNNSIPARALADSRLSGTIYAHRKDVSGSSFTFTDVSTEAASEVSNSFAPFGTTAQMSAGDEIYVSCADPIKEIFVDVDTPGVWAGTGLEIKYSNNGSTANATIQGLVDGSNGFRNADGVYRISFTAPSDIQSFSPVPGVIDSRRWLVIRPVGLASVTTAPLLRRIWILHADTSITHLDLTPAVGDDFAVVPAGSPTSFFPTVDSAVFYAFTDPAYGLERNIWLRMADVRTRVAEYLASDDTWKTLPGWTDPSNDFKNGPSPQAASPTRYSVRWTLPTDWAKKTLAFTVAGLPVSVEGYWVRERTTVVSVFGPTNSPLAKVRAKQFGNANTEGVQLLSATIFKGASLDVAVPATQQTVIQLLNFTQGAGRQITIAANAQHVDVDFADLSFAVNDKLGMALVSGGTLQSVDIEVLA